MEAITVDVSDVELLSLLAKYQANNGNSREGFRLRRIAAMVFEMENAQEHLASLTHRLSEMSGQLKREQVEQGIADLLGEAEGALRRITKRRLQPALPPATDQ